MNRAGVGDLTSKEPATLVEAILRARSSEGGIVFVSEASRGEFVPYRELVGEAISTLHHLQKTGIEQRSEIILQTEDLRCFVTTFWACVLGGYLAIPLAVGSTDEHRQRLANIWRILDDPHILTDDNHIAAEIETVVAGVDRSFGVNGRVLPVPKDTVGDGAVVTADASDTVYLQFSSGSTGIPKGVVLTHRNVLANIAGLIQGAHMKADDRFLSWMPLAHDMGMVGFHLTPLVLECTQVLMPTKLFVRRPRLWLDIASSQRASVLGSPNFGYRHLLNLGRPREEMWNLERVRIILNGAEPISRRLITQFMAKVTPYGLRESAMCPGYGLAEASLAVTVTAPGEEIVTVTLERRSAGLGNEVSILTEHDTPGSASFLDVGPPVPGISVRITDAERRPLPEFIVGNVEVRGQSVTSGYHNDPTATAAILDPEGWLLTGDLGFLRGGRLYITGRIKDIVFVNGVNYYPHDLERSAEGVDGIDLNKIAVCAVRDPEEEVERVLAFVLFKRGLSRFPPLARRLREAILHRTGVVVNECIPVLKIPKTTSGKIKRFRLAEQYLSGAFDNVLAELHTLAESTAVATRNHLMGRPLADIIAFVRDLAGRVAGYDVLDLSAPLVEQGFDSIRLTELSGSLGRELGIEVRISTVFDYPSVAALGGFVYGTLNPTAPRQRELDGQPRVAVSNLREPVAIVGMACRFPGDCDSPETFWELLEGGIDAVAEIPSDRWSADEFYDPDVRVPGKMTTRHGAFLSHVDGFDARFFAITPRESASIDPQQRLLLEVAWEALEDAVIDPTRLRGSATGVFVGVSNPDYMQAQARCGDLRQIDPYSFTGSAVSTASGR